MNVLQEGEKGKILVTGGAGFIGSALVWALNRMGIDAILLSDRLDKTEKFKNLTPLQFEDYVEADDLLRMVERNASELNEIRMVFHLGACSSTTERDGRFLIQNNYAYSKALAHWAVGRKLRFVYASSAATYGDGSRGMDDRDENLARLRPLNMYAYSKQLFDCYLQRRSWLNRVLGLKYFNVFGPNESHKGEMRSLVHKAFYQIQEEGCVHLFKSYHPDYADGQQERDFLYVKDAVAITLHLAQQPRAVGLFNVGSGRASTWLDLVRPLFAAMGRPFKVNFIEMPEALREKYQYSTCATIDKLRSLGYETPIRELADSVTDYVSHYLIPGHHLGDGLRE